MFYIYIILILFIAILGFYLFFKYKGNEENNLMEDVPSISVSQEDLEKHALEISQHFNLVTTRSNSRRKLLKSLDKSYRNIIQTYEFIDNEVKYKKEVVAAAEWMLDNLYLIEKEYKDIKYNMPNSYYKGLPVIKKGIMKGYPRIYHIAVELISHTDGRIYEDTIETFINAYQKNTILSMGELWALPIMIRIALIQNISKIAEKIAYAQKEKEKGELLAEELINAYNNNRLNDKLQELNDNTVYSSHFIEKFVKILRNNGIDSIELYEWLDSKLEIQQTTTDKIIIEEHQLQAAFQMSIGNSITSIREVGGIPWRDSFEKLSLVEGILKQDPIKIYTSMDFESRDNYRHMVEKIAKNKNVPEILIAKKAIECAKSSNDAEEYRKHIGYYLIDNGINELKYAINPKATMDRRFNEYVNKHKVKLYIGTIVILTTLLCFLILALVSNGDRNVSGIVYIIEFLALIIPCSEIVISIFNWSINRISTPRFMPKIEFKDGLPVECSTIVVIPTLLTSKSRAKELISDLEVYYLANREKNIYFALLGDFKDSLFKEELQDEEIIETALAETKKLNEKYSDSGEDIFYFFNRYRQFNENEGIWLGWERKRGKLMEFNALLRGNKNTSYNIVSGDIEKLKNVKYVITLDADTQLPRDIGKKLVGAMCHVLSKPYLDKEHKKVLRGYGLMQPRVSVGTMEANKTIFSKIFSGETGIDMYTSAISDVYQDIFGEGIFTGKGIYDIDVFNYMLKDEIPENKVLSHDLLEGSYVRAALLTDVELIDGYPAYYNSSSKRLHRWVRGDWQIISWITKKSPLNSLSRYKIFDNLRRSLLAPSIIMLVALSFLLFPFSDKGLVVALLALLCPVIFDVSEAVVSPVKGISLSGKISNCMTAIEQMFLIFCFLPYQAYLMIDAVIRTLYRLIISKRNLLEWQTAADVEAKLGRNPKSFIKSMWPGSLISLVILILSFGVSTQSGTLMIPSCLLWFISPIIAYFISKEIKPKENILEQEDVKLLRRFSRKTWAYFEDFVNDDNNWLAPDNFQEDPPKGVATRTSPTNMGMGLTANLVAYDLGYIGMLETVERLEKIIVSMEGLEQYKGHFYNWYDTVSKEPLFPRYVSTVDSGNLVGYLWLVSETLDEYRKSIMINVNKIQGLYDTFNLTNKEIEELTGIKELNNEDINDINQNEFDIITWKDMLNKFSNRVAEIEKLQDGRQLYWNSKAKKLIDGYSRELEELFPWVDMIYEDENDTSSIVQNLKNLLSQTPLYLINSEIEKIENDIERNMRNDSLEERQKDKIHKLKELLNESKENVYKFIDKISELKARIDKMAEDTNFTMLYHKNKHVFAIGYDIEKDSLSNSYYDLLASESRQASFVAIAKGDVEQEHWFNLSRAMTLIGNKKGLVSWSGTMFEYFMPLLILKNYPDTLLQETYNSVIYGQKGYCKDRNVPWGISESAFYTFDAALNYQYKAFGVPGIGLKRGLSNELVISPYSTIMALQIDLLDSINNMKRLINEGMDGKYGFYEALDYTKERVPKDLKKGIVKCFMVHHQGMSLMALNNVLNNNILQERFHRIPRVKATELLLQEKISKRIIYNRKHQFEPVEFNIEKQPIVIRKFNTANTQSPETNIISNGNYSVMLTNSGSGYSKCDELTVYRWREDLTLDNTGMFFYIKNLNSNEYWSAAYEPCKKEGDSYEVKFSLDKTEFKRKDGNLSTKYEIAVSQEDNAETRKISITNNSEHSRTIELTSYMEVTLAPYNADIVHPTFSNLFIRTEYVGEPACVIANRRPRAKGQKKPHVVQTVAVQGNLLGNIEYETSRANFIGRGNDVSRPFVMENGAPLTNTTGAVLDPIISMRVRLEIKAGETAKVAFTSALGNSREDAIELAKKYSQMFNVKRIFEMALTQTHLEMKYLDIKSTQGNLYQYMASKILFINQSLREREKYIKEIRKAQSSLWPYGISGDLPILLLILRNQKDLDLVRQLLKAHEYWSAKGLKVDLVILNLQNTVYTQPLQDGIRDMITSSHARDKENKPGGVFVHSKGTMSNDDVDFLIAIARLVIDAEKGSLMEQLKVKYRNNQEGKLLPVRSKSYNTKAFRFDERNLEYFNGYGGFDEEMDQYTIILKEHKNTPAPWINVISNGEFGFHISESGSSYTWYKNSRENKVTTWSNDPVTDPLEEALYLRDEETGQLWGITPKPMRDQGKYIIEHGFGYSRFKHEANGIIGEVTYFVPIDESVKLGIVKLKNNCDENRRLSLSYYAHMVLGVVPQQTAQYISTYLQDGKYIYAQNPYSEHFGRAYAYLTIAGGEETSYTGNRTEFFGRGGIIDRPKALKYEKFSNSVGSGYDPCLACNTKIEIKPEEELELVIILGQKENIENINKVVEQYSNIEASEAKLKEIKEYWEELLHRIQVKTPDKTMDILLNGWLMYQTISCRYWSRTAFYQSGGAIGFRDQLQDVMAIGFLNSEFTKEQILHSATRQFVEGDVQHWWHPVVNSGIRTRFSDDLLWLPYVTIDYIKNTGDYSILEEEAGYLEDEPLKEGEDERYKVTPESDKKGSIYEHCVRAIEIALKFGPHNIPLMGSGDWNDGMSTVGNEGRGESVWLGWFLYSILNDFKEISKYKDDNERAKRYEEMRDFIGENLEENAWDGGWYRRAYFDDGTPLGSIENDECQIDSLSQSWSVISGAGRESRVEEAMAALERYLVKENMGMVLLLTPAFNNSMLEPGYIKGYVPGVRENGGQYTHAATWVILAMTKLKYNYKAWRIFHMINPINHSKSYLECERYKVEPYVMTADIYATEGHEGRGGWSWYTGASGWMYRVGIDGILGLKLKEGKGFSIEPCIPDEWNGYEINYRKDGCTYHIQVKRGETKEIYLDGAPIKDNIIPYLDDGEHEVQVII
ncbi:GH36-type glycosyl hydrolase domain-containing protein [Clostridium sp. 'White wine YQ']|uniref:GH36-type glycosyl hydrolase domain-containing protein n=1 Tax=Clostridium sp. 'White wine YQ' TaxID=3027474 RepID=UPI00236590F4|nr:glucoamylase family protein [Clostridium sp. 'White wine YQ']MDD7795706.1 glucoamylase family protein [Clostridium sp. 'White wine YQ']